MWRGRSGRAGLHAILLAMMSLAAPVRAQEPPVPPASVTEAAVTLSGDEARGSVQARAAVRWLEQLHSNDDTAIRAQLRADPNIAALTEEQLTFLLGFAQAIMPPAEVFARTVDRVVITGDQAEVSAPGDENSRTTVTVRRDGDNWYVAAPSAG